MCWFTAANFSAEYLARKTGRGLRVVRLMRQYLAKQQDLYLAEQLKLPEDKRKPPEFFDYHIAENVYNIPAFSKPQQLIIGQNRQISVMSWGLRPRHASDKNLIRYIKENWFVNANGEDIFKKTTWPYYHIRKQRCLIRQSSFKEYHWFSNTDRQPYHIEFPDRPEFMIAGLYDVAPIPGKKGFRGGGFDLDNPDFDNYWYSFVQVTSEATPALAQIHNGGDHPHRMPLILREQDEKLWLDINTPDEVIMSLIKPYDEYPIKAWPISKKFNSMNPLSKELIDRVVLDRELDLDYH